MENVNCPRCNSLIERESSTILSCFYCGYYHQEIHDDGMGVVWYEEEGYGESLTGDETPEEIAKYKKRIDEKGGFLTMWNNETNKIELVYGNVEFPNTKIE